MLQLLLSEVSHQYAAAHGEIVLDLYHNHILQPPILQRRQDSKELLLLTMMQIQMEFLMKQFHVVEPIQILLLLMPKLILMFH